MGVALRVQKAVCIASGNRCAFPSCAVALYDPDFDIVIGEIAHVRSGDPTGPRFDPDLARDAVDVFANLVMFCPTHHTLVDKAPDRFPALALLEMKRSRESQAEAIAPELIARMEAAFSAAPAAPTFNVSSFNQRGGQTAAIITNIGPQPRTLKNADTSRLRALLSTMRKRPVRLNANLSVPDSQPLLQEINEQFRAAGWEMIETATELIFAVGGAGVPDGIIFRVSDDGDSEILELANEFVRLGLRVGGAYSNQKLDATGASRPAARPTELEIKIGRP